MKDIMLLMAVNLCYKCEYIWTEVWIERSKVWFSENIEELSIIEVDFL